MRGGDRSWRGWGCQSLSSRMIWTATIYTTAVLPLQELRHWADVADRIRNVTRIDIRTACSELTSKQPSHHSGHRSRSTTRPHTIAIGARYVVLATDSATRTTSSLPIGGSMIKSDEAMRLPTAPGKPSSWDAGPSGGTRQRLGFFRIR